MKLAPTVANIMKGFLKQDHQIDSITGKPERLAIDLLIEDITENTASIPTLKGGGLFGHTATCMSDAQYSTIPLSPPFIPAPSTVVLTFVPGNTVAGREDTKLLFYNNVYDFELESNLTTALRNILMAKLDESAYTSSSNNNMSDIRAKACTTSLTICSQPSVKRRMAWSTPI